MRTDGGNGVCGGDSAQVMVGAWDSTVWRQPCSGGGRAVQVWWKRGVVDCRVKSKGGWGWRRWAWRRGQNNNVGRVSGQEDEEEEEGVVVWV